MNLEVIVICQWKSVFWVEQDLKENDTLINSPVKFP